MKVILTENVKSLGTIGDIVKVSQGHARNFLIPKGFAQLADESNSKQMADYQKMLTKKLVEQQKVAEAEATKLKGITVQLTKKVGGNGRLFGTVTAQELAKELEKLGYVVEKRMIVLDDAIKTLGEFTAKVKLFKGVETQFKIKVTMDEAQVEEIKQKQLEAAARKEHQANKKIEEAAELAANNNKDLENESETQKA